MMDERNLDNPVPGLDLLRRELYADLELSASRLELERRRLVVNLGTQPSKGAARRPRRIAAVAAAGVAAIAASLLLVFAAGGPGEDEPVVVSGLWRVGPDDAVARGRPVTVPAAGGAKIVLEDGTTLWLAGSSTFVGATRAGRGFDLIAGRVLVDAAKRRDGSAFTVATAHGSVVVHGTVFSVALGPESMRVRLHEGAVDVRGKEEVLALARGHQIEVADGIALSAEPIDRTGIIEDLLIAERTGSLEGPALPALDRPLPEAPPRTPGIRAVVAPPVAPSPAANGAAPRSDAARAAARPRPTAPPALVAQPEEAPLAAFVDPDIAGIEVEGAPLPADEALFLEAYSEVTSGRPASGRRLLHEYLEAHPDGRYWARVKEILGE